MPDIQLNEKFWTDRYETKQTGWDIGFASTPLVEYINQIEDHNIKILIPGAGNSYEAEYFFKKGFINTFVLDISHKPLENLHHRYPDFPAKNLIHENFFHHKGQYDLIIEQTFFCALQPALRSDYAEQMMKILKPGGKLVGLWFCFPDRDMQQGPPFNGTFEEYSACFKELNIKIFEECNNSIPPRKGNELFAILQKPE